MRLALSRSSKPVKFGTAARTTASTINRACPGPTGPFVINTPISSPALATASSIRLARASLMDAVIALVTIATDGDELPQKFITRVFVAQMMNFYGRVESAALTETAGPLED